MKKIKPILFSTPMVQAIIEGRKTQTRRIIKSRHESGLFQVCKNMEGKITSIDSLDWDESELDQTNDIKPLANVGDILWVRETWQYSDDVEAPYLYKQKEQDELKPEFFKRMKWKPSIFMPKEACRIFLEVTNVRVERLQDISEEDAKAEGIKLLGLNGRDNKIYKNYMDKGTMESGFEKPLDSFISLWHSINGIESWIANPWVWVYDFKRVEKPENFLS